MRLQISIIIQEIVDKYNMKSLVDANGCFYMKTSKGMYGLKQGGIISHCKLIKHLAPYVYHPVPFIPSLWKHDTKPTISTLVVENVEIKYLNIYDADDIFSVLRNKYMVTTEMECKKCIRIKVVWAYIDKNVTLSIPNYTTT